MQLAEEVGFVADWLCVWGRNTTTVFAAVSFEAGVLYDHDGRVISYVATRQSRDFSNVGSFDVTRDGFSALLLALQCELAMITRLFNTGVQQNATTIAML